MRVPLAWLRDYVDLPADAQAVADLLASIGFPVDGIRERPAISGVVIGRIAALAKHPGADRLQVGEIETGGGTRLTIATAATNVAAGQTIAVATIGAQLPHVKIERRKMRGIESEGMMISAEELGLPSEWFEDGIMQFESDLALGADVVERFRLADAVLDVDVTNNRADAMSMVGLARELAAVQKTALRLPDLANPGDRDDGAETPIVSIESASCVRFVAQRFTGVRVGPSPAWMRIRLALAGQRPIDNVVDISNYVMLETGQPLHFYDDARIPNHHLIVRDAKRGEKLVTLDGVERELDPSALVVADEREAQALAGIKGGGASQVSASTSAVLLESANFDGARIRRTSAALGIRTDASTRHEKTLPLILSDYGAARAARLLVQSGATPFAPHAFGAPVAAMPAISFKTSEVKRLLGFDLAAGEIRGHMEALGFGVVQESAERLLLAPPPWRRDVTLGADVVEELARMAGYERIKSEIPQVFSHDIESRGYRLERTIARTLSALGYREIISCALHGARVFENLKRAGFTPSSPAVEVRNPLSEDQRYLRYALGPGLLEHFARSGEPARVFEIGHVFSDGDHPSEISTLAFGYSVAPVEEPPWRDTAFLRIMGDSEALVYALTGQRDYEVTPDVRNGLHPGKTAVLLVDGREIANVGQVDPRMTDAFGVAMPVYVCSISLDNIPDYRTPQYAPPSKYPSSYRDLALVCELGVRANQIERSIARVLGPLCVRVRVFDEYRGPGVGEGRKSITVRVTLQRADATITDAEADTAVAKVLSALGDELGATVRK